MTNKAFAVINKSIKIFLISILLIFSAACQNVKQSSYETAEKTISQAEVQAYFAAKKHYFNPH